jgi:hypothetical protein
MYKMKIEESHIIFKKLTNQLCKKERNEVWDGYVRFELQFFFFKFLFLLPKLKRKRLIAFWREVGIYIASELQNSLLYHVHCVIFLFIKPLILGERGISNPEFSREVSKT